ncbi:hypothetical protein LWI28_027804 [Acer negundo]|uniref:Uncharacterized protein n=1 Tax=Acer negundo TaxID=4023 RepID=A0AAD5IXN2_ACENE|nr:hypothetical protein LWI28_027804 [Acer negundo]
MCVCIVTALAGQYDSPTFKLLGGRRVRPIIFRCWKSRSSRYSEGISIGSLDHLLQVCDKDDATSALSEQPPLKPQEDCLRPALGSEWYRDYCSSFHATLSLSEEHTGLTPVVRPGGIHLKDSLLFVAANAKAQDLFDVTLLEGETVKEWLFFDKHKRAFESGRRKQRSLPDHSGRGWHESRKLVMREIGGQKKSYFMDPQPSGCFQWHLYEYEISNNSNA